MVQREAFYLQAFLYSVTFAKAAMLRKISGTRMTLMSSMNKTTLLAPGTGGLALNSFNILSEAVLQQRRPGLYLYCRRVVVVV